MIPLSTTTVTVTSVSEPEPGEGLTTAVRASNVRAHLSSPSGSDVAAAGGGDAVVDKRLVCDTVAIAHTDTVTDDSTADTYEVQWVDQREGLGLGHTVAGLVKVAGHGN